MPSVITTESPVLGEALSYGTFRTAVAGDPLATKEKRPRRRKTAGFKAARHPNRVSGGRRPRLADSIAEVVEATARLAMLALVDEALRGA